MQPQKEEFVIDCKFKEFLTNLPEHQEDKSMLEHFTTYRTSTKQTTFFTSNI
ncbi:hypothetical protein NEIRO02_1825 [Nematocida sp. AWRm79]|nr:hypothetical protein NEIRO02_1825 [Nematocida sp. AWRm79]